MKKETRKEDSCEICLACGLCRTCGFCKCPKPTKKMAGSIKLSHPTPPKLYSNKWKAKNFCGIAERTKKEATK